MDEEANKEICALCGAETADGGRSWICSSCLECLREAEGVEA